MKKVALLIIGLLIYNCAFLQNMPEIKVKPLKDKGKEKIYYRLKDGFVYFPNTNLIDWQNSLEMLEVTEKYNPKKQYFVESCKFSDGKKNGEFSISTLLLKETRTNYGSILFTSEGADIMTGNYVNSKFNGMINFLTYIDLSSKEGFVNLKYESGKIADQILKYPEVVKLSGKSFTPFVRFESGLVKESLYKDNYAITYIVFEDNKCSTMRYGNGNELSKIKFEGAAMEGLQCYSTVLENNSKNFVLNGSYRLYQSNNNLFDTTANLILSLNFKNGIQDGIQIVKSPNFNLRREFRCISGLIEGQLKGFIDDKINFTEEYLNGKLNGLSKTYFDDGKVAVEANYIDGHLSGLVKSYFNSNSKYNSMLLRKKINFTDIDLSFPENEQNVYVLSKIKEDMREIFQDRIIKDGGKINPSAIEGYFLCESLNFEYDDIKKISKVNTNKMSYFYSNGKVMVTIDAEAKDAIWFDSDGQKVNTLLKVQESNNKAKEAINNTIISCSFCSKKVNFGDAIITGGDCSCFYYKNGKKETTTIIGFSEKRFCSNKCRSEYEVDCCRRNGKSSE